MKYPFLQMMMGLRRAEHLLKAHSVRLEVEPGLIELQICAQSVVLSYANLLYGWSF